MSIPTIAAYPHPQTNDLTPNKVGWSVDPKRAVLLVHDMQDYFLRFYKEDCPLIQRTIDNIAKLRLWANEHGIPVVYTAQPTEQSDQERALLNDMWGAGLTTADPKLAQVHQALAPSADDIVLVKWRYSAFKKSNLEALMQQWGRDQLVVVGVYAHIGCMATVLEAFMLDIQAFMVSDATADFSREEHISGLNFVAGRCGAVVDTESVMDKKLRVEQSAVSTSKPVSAKPIFDAQWLTDEMANTLQSDDEILPDDNLVDHGLDSMQLMTLVNKWQKLGLRLQFEELAEEPSIEAWARLIDQQVAA